MLKQKRCTLTLKLGTRELDSTKRYSSGRIRIAMGFSVTGQNYLKLRWKNECASTPKIFVKKECVERYFHQILNHYKAIVIKVCCYCHGNGQIHKRSGLDIPDVDAAYVGNIFYSFGKKIY